MAKADVLNQVDAELSHGWTAPAIQRLSSLVAAHPTDLDLRRRLATVHQAVGNFIEAGRWAYLHADADPVVTRAFERAYPQPAHRLHRLRWPARGDAATEFARSRLETLGAAATARRRLAIPRRWRARHAVALLVAAPFAVLGALTLGQWLVG